MSLAGIIIILAPPLAFIMSVIALFTDESKVFAIAALLISLACLSLWFIPLLCG